MLRAGALVALVALLGVAPTATPTSLPKPTTGEQYFISSGHRTYLDWKRPQGAAIRTIRGHIEQYVIMAENSTDLPRSFIAFVSDESQRFDEPVLLAQPTTIDGKPFVCPKKARSSAYEFVRRFQVCAWLPQPLLHREVQITVYEMHYPDGGLAYVTDDIETK